MSVKAWESEKHGSTRMLCMPSGNNMISIACQHQNKGACGACHARWYLLNEEVLRLLKDSNFYAAIELIERVFAIATAEGKS